MAGLSDWRTRYSRRLKISDAFVVSWALAGAYMIRFGTEIGAPPTRGEDGSYLWLSLALALSWWLMLHLWGSRESRILGAGADEFKRVIAASCWLFGFVAVISYALRVDTARGFVGLAFPAGVVGLLVSRWLVRQHLHIDRKKGLSVARVLIIGGPYAASHLIRSLRTQPQAGYMPVAAHLPGASYSPQAIDELPIAGLEPQVPAILASIERYNADAVAISAGVQMHPQDLRRLGWELAARNVRMIMAPALTDVAGPRIHTQPVAGLPLIHVSTPKLTGGKKVAKRSFDIIGSLSLLILLLPIFVFIAVLVKISSPGPILYRQERIGFRGTIFKMLKFRSMKENADAELSTLLKQQGTDSKPLFKIDGDPRITPLGRILRKFSLDELPQLINVLAGSMSLVGPRPQREGEVALYDDAAHRRLYVSPGMSGLWQVSGRSDLTWEESIRLDLYYVENWSMIGDILILLKTFKAVFASTGAR